jgi:hypothetical protein
MNIRKRAIAVCVLGLFGGVCSPAWSADSAKATAGHQGMVEVPSGNSLLTFLKPVLTDTATGMPERDTQCKPSRIYSEHDVVGDPETCIMNRYTFGLATGAGGR